FDKIGPGDKAPEVVNVVAPIIPSIVGGSGVQAWRVAPDACALSGTGWAANTDMKKAVRRMVMKRIFLIYSHST
ncbi:MAG: hypothetical protein ACP5K1_05800, partial [Candidatus Bathyarchaeia archaeon]